jgi:hypothetical protein
LGLLGFGLDKQPHLTKLKTDLLVWLGFGLDNTSEGIFLVVAILVSPLSKDTDSNKGTKSVTQTFKWYRYLTKLKTD